MAAKLIPDSIRDVLDYNPDTGVFTWLTSTRGRKAGDTAGCVHKSGYARITYEGQQFGSHRLAWFCVHGTQPDVIDHINHNKSDNRIANLRNVGHSENALNREGNTGVHWSYARRDAIWSVVSTYKMQHLYRGNNITTAWYRRIMAERADHPIGLPMLD